ncbi:MAG: hemolysin family protein [Chloroflexi bacterium]|nr:hemolysin family protein [Chloroflexota bacterium]MCC6896838.1 HlyC/CorC family transporter [Anaerolineae bacterium]
MEILIILLLTVVNGILSMSEIAIVSARKVRLNQLATAGSSGAKRALELAESPNRFLSTVQIGITLVGVLQGAFAGAALAHPVATLFSQVDFLRPVSEALGLFVVVGVTTYLSLVIGELVPKRLGLQNPERVAALVAPAMHRLSQISAPFVHLLSISTDALLRLLGTKNSDEPPVTDEEIYSLMEQGVEAGVFEANEGDMVASIMSLDDRSVASLMTPRMDIEWIDLAAPPEESKKMIGSSRHSRFPAAYGSLDQVVGIIRSKDMLDSLLKQQSMDLNTCIREALFVPEAATAAHALALFKQSGKHMALVISEYGGVEGLITLNSLIDQIIGVTEQPTAAQREDGSWLLDGLLPIDEFKTLLDIKSLPAEEEGHYQTLGGFVMTQLGRIPAAADHFDTDGLRFEVMDMDGRRVDKVLVARIKTESATPQAADNTTST